MTCLKRRETPDICSIHFYLIYHIYDIYVIELLRSVEIHLLTD